MSGFYCLFDFFAVSSGTSHIFLLASLHRSCRLGGAFRGKVRSRLGRSGDSAPLAIERLLVPLRAPDLGLLRHLYVINIRPNKSSIFPPKNTFSVPLHSNMSSVSDGKHTIPMVTLMRCQARRILVVLSTPFSMTWRKKLRTLSSKMLKLLKE